MNILLHQEIGKGIVECAAAVLGLLAAGPIWAIAREFLGTISRWRNLMFVVVMILMFVWVTADVSVGANGFLHLWNPQFYAIRDMPKSGLFVAP